MSARKSPSPALPSLFIALSLFVLLATACNKRNQAPPEQVRDQALAWNLKTTVEAYDAVGIKSPQWDEPAKKALTEFAHSRAKVVGPDEPWGEIISNNVAAAVDAGCTDPMVTYLYIRFAMPQSNSKEEFAKRFYATANAMNGSSYPPVRKFYATARAMEQYYYTYDTKSNAQANAEVFGLLSALYQDVSETMADKTIPSTEASEITEQALHLGSGDANNADMFYNAIETPLLKNFANDYLPYYLKGNHYIELAWRARGSGYADTVTKEGAALFGTNIGIAREALEKAWALSHKESGVPIQMMTVVLGQGGDRKALELWFNRAMEADTNSYDACRNKMNFLDPKWYGSDEEQLAFGRECADSTKWGGHVPLILVLAHNTINLRLQGAAKTNYWKQPEVWSDLRTAYERYFELNPDETYLYRDYARFAYRAEQWDKLNELIPKLKTSDYDFFGGKNEYDKMVQLAKEHNSSR